MSAVMNFAPGGYRYLPSVFQYSGGVAAQLGYEVKRVRFRSPVPVAKGFDFIERFISTAGRPITALCACELRSPAPFTDGGFLAFNESYVARLRQWGLLNGDANPVARNNVCPEVDPPTEPSFYAFSFTIESPHTRPTFVIAGSGEVAEGLPESYADRAVRKGQKHLMRSAKKRALFWQKWNVASAFWTPAGQIRRWCKFTLFTISIRFWRMKLCVEVLRDPGRLGIMLDLLCSDLSTKWTAPV